MKYLFSILFSIFISVTISSADFSPSHWKFMKKIYLSDERVDIYELKLDTEILVNSKPDLSDIRIISNNQKEIPYVISIKNSSSKTIEYPVKLLNKSYINGIQTIVDIDIGNNYQEHNYLSLEISSHNYQRWVEVKAKSGGKWFTLTNKGFIFDHSIPEAGVSSSSNVVRYPLTNFRYLRVIIHDDGGSPLDITGAKIMKEQIIPAELIKYRISVENVGESKDGKFTEYLIDTGTENLPHNRIDVVSDEKNFHRRIVLTFYNDPDGRANFSTYQSTIYSYTGARYHEKNLTVTYPEARTRYIRVQLYHYDDPPLKVKDFHLYGTIRVLSFPSVLNIPTLYLFYGNSLAYPPVYDFAKYQHYLKGRTAIVRVGNQENNPLYRATAFEKFEKNKKVLLSILMAAVAIISGVFIIKSLKGITIDNAN
ncbi:MAG TPA: hypothetical protein PK303_05085 [bacterium]|nr:hypothetical protein [bacterium]HOL34754.1 hypothetical protein [bacterium]HPP08480.1 hypothetical protein [bacterium]